MSQGVPRSIITHAQRVCRMYKKALRTTEMSCSGKDCFRYEAVLIRAEIEKTRKETDMRKLVGLVEFAEEECWRRQHPQPLIFKDDPGGITWQRYAQTPDDVLDHWHPWEKATFIDYFELREKRKLEAEEYYKTSLMNKSKGDLSKIEYPIRSPQV